MTSLSSDYLHGLSNSYDAPWKIKVRRKTFFGLLILIILYLLNPLAASQAINKKNDDNKNFSDNRAANNGNDSLMPHSALVALKVSQFIAREDQSLPTGASSQVERDIGHAVVFLTLENHQEANQTVNIQNIEIRNISDNQLQLFTFEARQIELNPLENSVVSLHSTNQSGYISQDWVKAVITYKIGNQVDVIESEAVEVNRY